MQKKENKNPHSSLKKFQSCYYNIDNVGIIRPDLFNNEVVLFHGISSFLNFIVNGSEPSENPNVV